ncbi:MAG: UDP-glucose 4-epimerase GalE [Proteobacteria bacterium]|nr:UDP-glucose 4-epimerase GalE [Pseudomonadota bacterium]
MSRILITGGAGFVGSHAVKVAVEAGHEVTVLDNLELGHRNSIPDRALLIQADLRDYAGTLAALEQSRPEVIMHFAAYALVAESVQEPARYYRNNIGGLANLLEAAKVCAIDRFIFSSTAATYGIPKGELTESHPNNPINPYGSSKLFCEALLREMSFSSGLRVIVFRYFNVAGADPDGSIGEDHNPESHLIPNAINAALGRGATLTVFGNDYPTHDGTCVRDYIHARDLARAHLMGAAKLEHVTANHGRGYFDVFNIGTGRGCSVLEVVAAVEEVTGLVVPYSIAGRRPGDPASLVANVEKIQQQLGWAPEYPNIRDSVRHAYAWMQRNPQGYGDHAAQ